MKHWIKSSIKITSIVIASVLATCIIAISVILYIVLTPEKLTSIVDNLAKEYIVDAKLSFEEIDLTLFSSLPNVGIKLTNGVLKTKHIDTLMKTDTIVSFENVELLVNPFRAIIQNSIAIEKIILDSPVIYAYVSEYGKANWNVFNTKPQENTMKKFDVDDSGMDMDVELQKFILQNGNVTYDDHNSKLYSYAQNINVTLSGNMMSNSNIKTKLSMDDFIVWQEGVLLADKWHINIECEVFNVARELIIERMHLGVNGMGFDVRGAISADTVDVKAILKSGNIEQIKNLVPDKFLKEKENIIIDGVAVLNVQANGKWSKSSKPKINIIFDIENANVHYKGFKYGIDTLDVSLVANIDLNEIGNSSMKINRLYIDGLALNIDVKGEVSNVIQNPMFRLDAKANINFETLASTIPYFDSIDIKGLFYFEGGVNSNIYHITHKQWNKIQVRGTLELHDFMFIDTVENIKLATNYASLKLSNNSKKGLGIKGYVGDVRLSHKQKYDIELYSTTINLDAFVTKDSISALDGSVGYQRLVFSIPKDSVKMYSYKTSGNIVIQKNVLEAIFNMDTLSVNMIDSRANLINARINAYAGLSKRDISNYGATVGFDKIVAHSNYLPLPITIGSTQIKMQDDKISLSKMKIYIGDSDFELSGDVHGFFGYAQGDTMSVKGELRSSNIDVNELLFAMNEGDSIMYYDSNDIAIGIEESSSPTVLDTVIVNELPVVILPTNIFAELVVSVDNIKLGNSEYSAVEGSIVVDSGEARIEDFKVNYKDITVSVNALYKTQKDTAILTLALKGDDIDIRTVREMIPVIDSLLPMIKDLDGNIYFDIVTNTSCSKFFSVDLEVLSAAVLLRAAHIEIGKNETTRAITKMLMFKDKQAIRVDSLVVQINVDNGVVDMSPFILVIDRYKIGLGGVQSLSGEMDLDYHVSLLKSPIPIKIGVNIKGPMDDFKIGIGRSKYKYLLDDDGTVLLTPAYIEQRDSILKLLEGEVNESN